MCIETQYLAWSGFRAGFHGYMGQYVAYTVDVQNYVLINYIIFLHISKCLIYLSADRDRPFFLIATANHVIFTRVSLNTTRLAN